MFFAGRRWVITESHLDGMCLENKSSVVGYMSDHTKFNTIQSTYRHYFASAPMDKNTPSNTATPNLLNCFLVRTNVGNDDTSGDDQYSQWWDPVDDEPIEAVLHCAFCNNFENPCENGGTCNFKKGPKDSPEDGVCECLPDTTGALGEYEFRCNDVEEDDTTKQYGCKHKTPTCTASGKCENCPIITFGSLCQIDIDCSVAASILHRDIGGDFDGCFNVVSV